MAKRKISQEDFVKMCDDEIARQNVALKIKRLPKQTIELFSAYAKEHCCNDYGWALTDLVNKSLANPHEQELNEIKARLDKIEEKGDIGNNVGGGEIKAK